jgi:hypothetical protein
VVAAANDGGMALLASLADFLADVGPPIGGGAGLGAVAGFWLGQMARAWLYEDYEVPVGAWVGMFSGLGGTVGLVAALYEQ